MSLVNTVVRFDLSLENLFTIIDSWQKLVIIDERNVCVYSGRTEDVPKLLHQKKIEKISNGENTGTLLIRIIS